MADTTPKGLRYPEDSDAPNIAVDIENLATDVDNELDNYIANSIVTAEGDLITASGSATPVRLGIGAAGRVLSSDGTAVSWAIDPVSDLITTAGDLIYGSAADTAARLAIGTANQVLAVNSGATAPEWVTPAAGGMTLISTTSLTSGVSVTLSSIPSTFKHLFLTITGLTCSANDDIRIRFNGNSNNEYSVIDFTSSGTGGAFNLDRIALSDFASANADKSAGQVFISDYLDTTQYGKLIQLNYMGKNTAGTRKDRFGHGYYQETAAISSIEFATQSGTVTFTTGTLKLYGVS